MLHEILMNIVVTKPRKIKYIINWLINIIRGKVLLRQLLIYILLLFVLFYFYIFVLYLSFMMCVCVCLHVVLFLLLAIRLFIQHVNKHKLNYYSYSHNCCVTRMTENTKQDKMLTRNPKHQPSLIFFFWAASTGFRVLTFFYGVSRSSSFDTPCTVGLLQTSDQPDAETAT